MLAVAEIEGVKRRRASSALPASGLAAGADADLVQGPALDDDAAAKVGDLELADGTELKSRSTSSVNSAARTEVQAKTPARAKDQTTLAISRHHCENARMRCQRTAACAALLADS